MPPLRPEAAAFAVCFAADGLLRALAAVTRAAHHPLQHGHEYDAEGNVLARTGMTSAAAACVGMLACLCIVALTLLQLRQRVGLQRRGALATRSTVDVARDWFAVLAPSAVAVAVYEWLTTRLVACAPEAGAAYTGGALLLFAVPFLRYLGGIASGGNARSMVVVSISSLIVLHIQTPHDAAGGPLGYPAVCVADAAPRAAALSFAVASLSYFADIASAGGGGGARDALAAAGTTLVLYACTTLTRWRAPGFAVFYELCHGIVYAGMAAAVVRGAVRAQGEKENGVGAAVAAASVGDLCLAGIYGSAVTAAVTVHLATAKLVFLALLPLIAVTGMVVAQAGGATSLSVGLSPEAAALAAAAAARRRSPSTSTPSNSRPSAGAGYLPLVITLAVYTAMLAWPVMHDAERAHPVPFSSLTNAGGAVGGGGASASLRGGGSGQQPTRPGVPRAVQPRPAALHHLASLVDGGHGEAPEALESGDASDLEKVLAASAAARAGGEAKAGARNGGEGLDKKPRNWRDDLSADRKELFKQLEGRVNHDRPVHPAVIERKRDAAAEDTAANPAPWHPARDHPANRLVNGVIIFMDSERKPLTKTLPLLQQHFLGCFPYPITVFKEDMTPEYKAALRALTTSKVNFQPIGHIFDRPPNNITKETATFWIEIRRFARGHHFGYRMMCRFFSGVFARYAFLKRYEYYWRLDTDSFIRKPVLVDPFRLMVTGGCSYGFIGRFHTDAASTTVGLYDTVLEWAGETGVPSRNISRMHRHLLGDNGAYKRLLYYNNFEIASVPWITSDAYTSFFDYLDYGDGFIKSRWGDAPVRTLAVHMMLGDREVCNFEKYLDYKHGYWKNDVYDPVRSGLKRPDVCPAGIMAKDASNKYYQSPPVYLVE